MSRDTRWKSGGSPGGRLGSVLGVAVLVTFGIALMPTLVHSQTGTGKTGETKAPMIVPPSTGPVLPGATSPSPGVPFGGPVAPPGIGGPGGFAPSGGSGPGGFGGFPPMPGGGGLPPGSFPPGGTGSPPFDPLPSPISPAFSPMGGSTPIVAPSLIPIPERTPIKELMPTVPTSLLKRPVHLLPRSLDEVTEVAFQEPLPAEREKALTQTRMMASKILHLHKKKHDSYMEALIESRADLKGMPFVLGGACRVGPDRMVKFSGVLNLIRNSMPPEFNQPLTLTGLAKRESNDALSDQFWTSFTTTVNPFLREAERGRDKAKEVTREAHVAALMQVCGPEQGAMRRGLTRHVAGIAHVESTRALAKLAIFSPEEDVRQDAIDALKVRKDKDYTEVLMEGLTYPWPEVADRAVEAIIKLERKDMLAALIDVLEQPDPRFPREVEKGGKKVAMVREMVRVNHHRNCFLCHAPAQGDGTEVLTGAVPIPGEQLPSFSDGYRNSTPDLAVRIDVTYLRQDFSAFMKVENHHLWPEMQRFDFLVRNRALSGEELAAFKKIEGGREEGVLNPYHRSAVRALRELTGRDAAPSAEAWRRLLKLPARGT